MEIVGIVLSSLSLIMLAVLFVRISRMSTGDAGGHVGEEIMKANRQQTELLSRDIQNLKSDVTGNLRIFGDLQTSALKESQNSMSSIVNTKLEIVEKNISRLEETLESRLQSMQNNIRESLSDIRNENSKKLDEIRTTVDEKLNETLNRRITESFKTVSDQLEQVYKGLGEMQNLAHDVGGLKQVLSGVKTRGILGEIQLSSILSEILSPEQYDTDVATIPGSRERVEFAVRLPGQEGRPVYLPIDSKFPGDRYNQLKDAIETGDRDAVNAARSSLIAVLKAEAKDIREKYVEPPYTTAFGIMFLPFEGLYAEVVDMGMVEVLQREYNINIAGPSTMAAMLNSLQMGFKTLAIQKRSKEVWKILSEVKGEFGKFESLLVKMQNHLNLTTKDLESLIGTRTKAILRKLRNVVTIDYEEEEELEEHN